MPIEEKSPGLEGLMVSKDKWDHGVTSGSIGVAAVPWLEIIGYILLYFFIERILILH